MKITFVFIKKPPHVNIQKCSPCTFCFRLLTVFTVAIALVSVFTKHYQYHKTKKYLHVCKFGMTSRE